MICMVLACAIPSLYASETSVKTAMCQIFALDGDREGNFVRIEAGIQEAVDQGAKIVCFPETCVLGWINPAAFQQAFPVPGQDSNRLSKVAKKYGVFLCVGLAEKQGDQLYDSVILLDDQGTILLKHRKINTLKELMDPPYTRGTEVNVVDTPFGKIGLLVCADSFDMSVCKRMAQLKPDLVIIPYGWAEDKDKWPQHGESLKAVVQHAAKTINATVIGTDLVGQISQGPWKDKIYGGQSVAATAKGDIMAVARDRQRDIKVVTVTLKGSTEGK